MDIRQLDFKDKRIIGIITGIVLVVSFLGYIGIKAAIKNDGYEVNVLYNRNTDIVPKEDDNGNQAVIDSNNKEIWIHVTGYVKNPGPVNITDGQRIKDAIDAAGGLLPEANADAINMVYTLKDGQKIYVPSKKEVNEQNKNAVSISETTNKNSTNIYGITQGSIGIVGEDVSLLDAGNSKKININKATASELEKLPGVGPATSAKIIAYRDKLGGYKKIEEIMSVNGIGTSKFNKMKEMITVDQ